MRRVCRKYKGHTKLIHDIMIERSRLLWKTAKIGRGKNWMSKYKLVQNTLMLYIMNIAKLIFPLLTLPYLTRVLSVEKYAMVTYVKALMTYAQLVVDFGFLLSATRDIVVAKGDKDKIGCITGEAMLGRVILAGISFVFVAIISFVIPILRQNTAYVILSFAAVAATVFFVDFLFRGLEKMQVITMRYLITRSIATILTFVLIKNDSDILFVPSLEIIGNIIAVGWIWFEVRKNGISVRIGSLKSTLIKIKESFVYFCSSMASTAFGALNTMLIGIFCSAQDVAFWGLATQLVNAVQALYTPVTNGVYPHMIREKSIKVIKTVLAIYMPIIVAGCLLIYFKADIFLLLIGGQKYAIVAPLLKWFIPLLFISFPAMLFGWPVLGAIGKTRETTKTTVITAIVQVAGLLVLMGVNRFTLQNIAILRALTEMIMCSMRIGYCYKYRDLFAN